VISTLKQSFTLNQNVNDENLQELGAFIDDSANENLNAIASWGISYLENEDAEFRGAIFICTFHPQQLQN
jgi:hypothetical protein